MRLNEILKELRADNSRNYKLGVLEKLKNDEDFKLLCQLALDKVRYKFQITNHVLDYSKSGPLEYSIHELKELLEPVMKRELTGNAAINHIQNTLSELTKDSQELLTLILDRDLKCGVNAKSLEKYFKGLIFELPYMGCSGIEALKNIKFPAILQLKADGTYRTAIVRDGEVEFYSRSGEQYYHPSVAEELKVLPDGVYIGEMIVNSDSLGLDGSKASETRYASNGALNSLNPPEDVTYFLWDTLSLEDFTAVKTSIPYKERFEYLQSILMNTERLKPIESCVVNSYEEASQRAKEFLQQGFEGAVLKDFNVLFENKYSKFQIKMKYEFDVDVKCVGFTEGKGRFADTFGAIEFESSDGLLKGQCSGIPDALRTEISKNRDSYIGKVFAVKANDVTLAKDSKIYGLMHPQFKGFRNDKTEADDIERILNVSKGF